MKQIFNEFRRSTFSVAVTGISFLVYFLTDIYCGNKCGVVQDGDRFDIFVTGILWFLPTFLLLLFVDRRVSFGWLRHIGWWFSILFPVMAMQFTGGGIFSMEEFVAILMMVILFVITLVYALVMRKRLKDVG